MLEKQSKIQLAREEYEEVQNKFYEERKQSVIADFKIRKKEISHQLDLLEKNVIDDDSQIVEIDAKKELDDTTHYHVEVIAL